MYVIHYLHATDALQIKYSFTLSHSSINKQCRWNSNVLLVHVASNKSYCTPNRKYQQAPLLHGQHLAHHVVGDDTDSDPSVFFSVDVLCYIETLIFKPSSVDSAKPHNSLNIKPSKTHPIDIPCLSCSIPRISMLEYPAKKYSLMTSLPILKWLGLSNTSTFDNFNSLLKDTIYF